MKCKYCNSVIEGNEKFCPYCGKEVKMADTLQPYQKSKSSKKWLWIILGVILLCAVFTFFHFSSSSDEVSVDTDNNEIVQESGENSEDNEILNRLEEIYSTVYEGGVLDDSKIDQFDNMFCSADLMREKRNLSNKILDYFLIAEPPLFANHWTLTLDDFDNKYEWKILDVKKLSDEKATAKVQIKICDNDITTIVLDLIYEQHGMEKRWYIDDVKIGTQSEKEVYDKEIKGILDEVDKYFADYGESYLEVRCISYLQMKKIVQNDLSVAQMNCFAKHFGYYYEKPSVERDYQTPRYMTPSSSEFEVRLSRINGKLLYNFWCRTKDKNEEYFEKLCSDLREDANEITAIGSGYRGIVNGFEYIEVDRDNTFLYVRILKN